MDHAAVGPDGWLDHWPRAADPAAGRRLILALPLATSLSPALLSLLPAALPGLRRLLLALYGEGSTGRREALCVTVDA